MDVHVHNAAIADCQTWVCMFNYS